MRKLTESMTDYGAPVGSGENASWIEAIGFFAGWGLPLYLARSPREAPAWNWPPITKATAPPGSNPTSVASRCNVRQVGVSKSGPAAQLLDELVGLG